MRKARKFNAKVVEHDGLVFDSKTELEYYLHLKSRDDVREIQLQPVYKIIPDHFIECGRCESTGRLVSEKTGNPVQCTLCKGKGQRSRQGAIYTADFIVTYSDGRKEVVDVKGGPTTPVFQMRKKLYEMKTGKELVIVRKGKKGTWITK